jgi:hypothetical protein
MSEANHSPKFSPSLVTTILVMLLVFAGLAWFLTYQRESVVTSDHERREQRLKNLADLAVENQKTLASYHWVDKEKGIVGVPIDRAMELEIADLSAKHPHAAGPITLPAPSPTPAPSGSPAQKPAPSPATSQPSASPAGAAPSPTGTPPKP